MPAYGSSKSRLARAAALQKSLKARADRRRERDGEIIEEEDNGQESESDQEEEWIEEPVDDVQMIGPTSPDQITSWFDAAIHATKQLRTVRPKNSLRSHYTGDSKQTKWRKRIEGEKMAEHAKKQRKITDMFKKQIAESALGQQDGDQAPVNAVVNGGTNEQIVETMEEDKIEEAVERLGQLLQTMRNRQSVLAKEPLYDVQRLLAVRKYLILRVGGKTKKKRAGMEAARTILLKDTG